MSHSRPFLLGAYVDFRGDVEHGTFTHELLDEMMALFRSIGVRRVYWWFDGDIDPDSYWFNGLINTSTAYGSKTLEHIGEPVKAAAGHAHQHGLELYGILYPYCLARRSRIRRVRRTRMPPGSGVLGARSRSSAGSSSAIRT